MLSLLLFTVVHIDTKLLQFLISII